MKYKLTSTLKGFYYSAQFHAQGFLLTAGGDIGKGELRAWDRGRPGGHIHQPRRTAAQING